MKKGSQNLKVGKKQKKGERKTNGMWKRKLSRRRNNGACRRVDVSLLPAHSPREVGVLRGGAGASESRILPLSQDRRKGCAAL